MANDADHGLLLRSMLFVPAESEKKLAKSDSVQELDKAGDG